jgi:YHS domain-containing protein
MKFLKLSVLALLATAALPLASYADDEQNLSSGIVATGKPLAIHGFDPVAYFTVGAPTQGSAKFALVHNGATYYFASQANLETFKADPDKYVPIYGGYCAFGVSVNKKFDGDPRYFTIHNGHLYLNLNEDIAKKFKADVPGSVKKADENWKTIESKPVKGL